MHSHLPSRNRRLLLACAGFAWFVPIPALATPLGGERQVAMRLVETGTITKLDPQVRRITLKTDRGTATFSIDKKVQNLDQLKVGERVQVDYVAAITLTLRRGGTASKKVESDSSSAAPPDDKAGIAYGRRTKFTADVVEVDKANQTLRLRGPQGRVSDFHVRDKVDLAGVKPGDQLQAVVYEATAVAVTPAADR